MPEFCSCGSIIINSKCTNKNCAVKSTRPGAAETGAPAPKAARSAAKEPKSSAASRTRKTSKCITYSLKELEERERERKEKEGL